MALLAAAGCSTASSTGLPTPAHSSSPQRGGASPFISTAGPAGKPEGAGPCMQPGDQTSSSTVGLWLTDAQPSTAQLVVCLSSLPFLEASLDHIALTPSVVRTTGSASVVINPMSLSVDGGVLSDARPYFAKLSLRGGGRGMVVVDVGVTYLDKNGKLLDDTLVRGKLSVGTRPLQLT